MSIAERNQKRHNHYAEGNVNRCHKCQNFIAKPSKQGLNRVKCGNCGHWNHAYTQPETVVGD